MPRASNRGTIPLKPLDWYKRLATEKGRLESGAFLVEGDRAIGQLVGSRPDQVIEVVAVENLPAVYLDYPVRFVTDSQFRSICLTKTPQGPLAVVRMPEDIYSGRLPESIGGKVLLLEDVQDPGNVGTLIRTAAAFNFSGAILSGKCADPLSPKCVQATAGAVLSVWMRKTAHYLDLVKALRRSGYSLVAADLNGEEDPAALRQQHLLLLALGNEASGLSEEMLETSDHRFRIPIDRDKAESLNVAVSGAICMYLSTL
ncbi:MAG: RNA methyltransferase [Dehalococcoidia bacterium]